MGRPPKKAAEAVGEQKSKVDEFMDPELDIVLSSIEKDFGKGAIRTMEDYNDAEPLEHISSGSIELDLALGKGGFVFGRVIELFGPEGAGKSTECIEVISRAQKLGLRCAFIDKEHALDIEYCNALGVDIKKLYISQPNSGEEALEIVERLAKSKKFDVIILDSVAALNPTANLDKTFFDNAKMAGRAGILTQFFEKDISYISKNKVLVIFTNQLRDGLSPYGPKEVTAGGHALKHNASQRLEIRPKEKITDSNGVVIGNTIRVITKKNRLNVPYKEVFLDVIFGKGIDKVKDVITMGISAGVVQKAGSWLSFTIDEKETRVQGIDQMRGVFAADSELFEKLRAKVISIVGPMWGPEGKSK